MAQALGRFHGEGARLRLPMPSLASSQCGPTATEYLPSLGPVVAGLISGQEDDGRAAGRAAAAATKSGDFHLVSLALSLSNFFSCLRDYGKAEMPPARPMHRPCCCPSE